MTAFDPDSGLHLPTTDHDLATRTALLHQLSLDGEDGLPEFDALAAELGQRAGVPYAMVNFITDQQHFSGLYVAPGARPISRTMAREHGYCPDVLDRPVALILPDVRSHPRFQSNQVVDSLGVLTYSGAPLIHQESKIVLGTACFIGLEPLPRETGQRNRALVKSIRDQAMDVVRERAAGMPVNPFLDLPHHPAAR